MHLPREAVGNKMPKVFHLKPKSASLFMLFAVPKLHLRRQFTQRPTVDGTLGADNDVLIALHRPVCYLPLTSLPVSYEPGAAAWQIQSRLWNLILSVLLKNS